MPRRAEEAQYRKLGAMQGHLPNKKQDRAERRGDNDDRFIVYNSAPEIRVARKKRKKEQNSLKQMQELLDGLAQEQKAPDWEQAKELLENPNALLRSYTKTAKFEQWYEEVVSEFANPTVSESSLDRLVAGSLFQNLTCDFLAATEFNQPGIAVVQGEDLLNFSDLLYPGTQVTPAPFGLSSLDGATTLDFLVLQKRSDNHYRISWGGDCSTWREKNFHSPYETLMRIREDLDIRSIAAPGRFLAVVPKGYVFQEEGTNWFEKARQDKSFEIKEMPFNRDEWGHFLYYVYNIYTSAKYTEPLNCLLGTRREKAV